jgi:peptidyl-prolyl cis-trans isomerase B (cyclophilin B)
VPRPSRQRQLAKLAARRQAERRRRRRQRLLAGAIAAAVALGGGGFAAAALLTGGSPGPANRPSPTPTPPASSTPSATGVACGAKAPAAAAKVASFNGKYKKPPKTTISTKKTYVATMRTSCGTITIALDPKDAPNTVNSLVFLARQHFFDGSTFHRIAKNFVIQGGDPTGQGSGGPGYSTVDAPPKGAMYPVGTMAMAKTSSDPAGTSGSQFFIVTSASAQSALAPGGVGAYAIVGHVTSGMDVVQKIAALPIKGGGTDGFPAQTVYIDKVTIKVEG